MVTKAPIRERVAMAMISSWKYGMIFYWRNGDDFLYDLAGDDNLTGVLEKFLGGWRRKGYLYLFELNGFNDALPIL